MRTADVDLMAAQLTQAMRPTTRIHVAAVVVAAIIQADGPPDGVSAEGYIAVHCEIALAYADKLMALADA